MTHPRAELAIDARPVGPDGQPYAVARVLGESMLLHQLRLAGQLGLGTVTVHRGAEPIPSPVPPREGRVPTIAWSHTAPEATDQVLRTDRLYDPKRLRRALRAGRELESAVLWRLDQAGGLEHAEAELVRRRTYQPLGRYWALGPARWLARRFQPTAVRPNHLTLAAGACMLGAILLAAIPEAGPGLRLLTALGLALGLVLDTADGHLARLQGTASGFGRWLDATLDEVNDHALHAAIGWSAFASTGSPLWLLLTTLYSGSKALFQFSNQLAEQELQSAPVELRPTESVCERSSARRLVELAGHADLRWHLWIVLALIGQLWIALVLYAIYFPVRFLAGSIGKAVRHA